MAYADDITITSTHTPHECSQKYIQPYLHKVFAWTKQYHTKSRQNNLQSVHARPCRIYKQSGPKYTQQYTTHGNAPKGSVSYLRPKLTYSTHTHNISVHAHKPLQIIKALTATVWGKQKETLMATYQAVMRPALEYASSIWSPLASSKSINKLQVMQNAELKTATGCTHLHAETLTLPILEHLQLTTPHNTNRKHNIHHIHYTNTQHT